VCGICSNPLTTFFSLYSLFTLSAFRTRSYLLASQFPLQSHCVGVLASLIPFYDLFFGILYWIRFLSTANWKRSEIKRSDHFVANRSRTHLSGKLRPAICMLSGYGGTAKLVKSWTQFENNARACYSTWFIFKQWLAVMIEQWNFRQACAYGSKSYLSNRR